MILRRHWSFKVGILLFVGGIAVYLAALIFVPSPSQIREMALGSDRVLLAKDQSLLQTLRTDFNQRRLAWFSLRSFPTELQDAVITAEDQRFRSHLGFDLRGLARAIRANLTGQPIQGASTITMQLGDLIQEDVLVKHQRIQKGSLWHKGLQLLRAVLIEVRWSKNEILEAYLNLIHLRGEYQGVPAFSYAYMNRHPLALDGFEDVVIATMVSSPNQKAESLKTKSCALYRKINGEAASCDRVSGVVDSLAGRRPSLPASPGFAPHLARRLFIENPRGSILTSTIDSALQQKVISILEKNIFRLKRSNVQDSAAIVIENRTGRVLAYVGAVSTSESEHVDGAQAYRQAGSSLKPFLYAKAIDGKTLTAGSILLDDPTAISWGNDVYRPTNYDRHFSGAVSVREALASSLNVPAVKTVTIIGLHQTYGVLQSLHLSNLKEPDFYGVSMALGAVEVRLDELANAYRMLANGGMWTPLSFLENSIKTEGTRIFSPEAAFIISSILSDPNARSIGFGWENPLETPFWTAVKTGTSKDYRDNWCLGFSELYTVGVWAGNFNAEAMDRVSGVSGVGPSWFEIMTHLHSGQRSLAPAIPEGVTTKKIRHSWVSHEHDEYFIKGTEPSQNVIELAPDKKLQFIFPAQGSVLVSDPHLDSTRVALFVRFKGEVPQGSTLLWDEKPLGLAVSPFKVEAPKSGTHTLSIVDQAGKSLATVRFQIKGAL